MSEIQCIKIDVCTLVVAQMGRDKPFNIDFSKSQAKAFWIVMDEVKCYSLRLPVSKSGRCIEINNGNSNELHHSLSTYIAKHSLPESVLKSLKEVS